MKTKRKLSQIEQIVMIMLLSSLVLFSVNAINLAGLDNITRSTVSSIATDSIIPAGIPAIYGEEIGVSFDGVKASNPQLADQTITRMKLLDIELQLEGPDLERYVNILYHMHDGLSCEYCCGARSIIFEDGSSACGCAHSYAMRGLTKYLILEHGSKYTDEEIFEEISKWKMMFFPTQMTDKAQIMDEQNIATTYANIAGNEYRGIEQGRTQGSMVGGC